MITAIIVTFNRKFELIRCLNAVLNQTKNVDNIIIVNNASTDNTLLELFNYLKLPYINLSFNSLLHIYVKKFTNIYLFNSANNIGGSGGFYIGLKTAYENLCGDYFWLMDDDGYPDKRCLENLLYHVDQYNYVMPVSVTIDDHNKLSWPTRLKNGKKTELLNELLNDWGKVMDHVTPFNGVLLNKLCIEKVGYINKKFFIWGDDYEHYYRCRLKGINPVTLLNSIFYHPAQKIILYKIFFGLFQIPYSDNNLKFVCMIRNWTYIYLHYNMIWRIPIKFLMYSWFFLFTRKCDFKNFKLYCGCVLDAFKDDFTRHLKYLKDNG